MSGKSTFLRSLGINQVLACAGAPVFADKFQTSFGKVLTCIEVSDSVTTGISHFYAEVLRVKMILDEAQKPGFSIILIDEIFRGTNNRERFLGAQAIIQFLTQQQNVVSFITTHDIELATQKGISNYHFRDEVHEDKMCFVYKIFKGPCTTTNGLRLMQMSGLPVSF